MFLDNTYFQGELSIPNLIFVEPKGVGTMIQAVNEQSFDWYLGKYEVKFMNELLGSEMYARMMKEIEDGNEWGKLRNKIFVFTGSGNILLLQTMCIFTQSGACRHRHHPREKLEAVKIILLSFLYPQN